MRMNQIKFTLACLLYYIFYITMIACEKVSKNSILSYTDGNLTLMPSISAVLAILGGTIICFFGYRLYHPVLYALTFSFGGLLGYVLVYEMFQSYEWVVLAAYIGFIVIGLIFLSILKCFYFLAIFMIGAAAGIVFAFFIHTSFLYQISPKHSDTVLIIAVIICAIIGGILTRKLEKPAIIIATSIFGSIASIWGIGYFIGNYPSSMNLQQYRSDLTDENKDIMEITLPKEWWGYFTATIVLCVLGFMVQFRIAKRHNQHTQKHYRSAMSPV